MDKSQNYFYGSFLVNALENDIWRSNIYKDSLSTENSIKIISENSIIISGNYLKMAGFNDGPEYLKNSLSNKRLIQL